MISFLKPTNLKLKILVGLILIVLLIQLAFANSSFSTPTSITPSPSVQGSMLFLSGINLVLSVGTYVSLPLCPQVGDSDPDTHGCGGSLPEPISWTIIYGAELLYLYLISSLLAQAFLTLNKKKAR